MPLIFKSCSFFGSFTVLHLLITSYAVQDFLVPDVACQILPHYPMIWGPLQQILQLCHYIFSSCLSFFSFSYPRSRKRGKERSTEGKLVDRDGHHLPLCYLRQLLQLAALITHQLSAMVPLLGSSCILIFKTASIN